MGGYDCHAHSFPIGPFSAQARYRPPYAASLSDWRRLLANAGMTGGVLVQPSFLGDENRHLLTALTALGPYFRGVADVGLAADEERLQRLRERGVAGLRWNLLGRPELPSRQDPRVERQLELLAQLGLHLQLHVEGQRLPPLLAELRGLPFPVVIDHFGRPDDADPVRDPAAVAIGAAARAGSEIWVKLSAPYRAGAERLERHVDALIETVGKDRLVWGSDWPWTQYEGRTTYSDLLDRLRQWLPDESLRRLVLDENPRRLYGFGE